MSHNHQLTVLRPKILVQRTNEHQKNSMGILSCSSLKTETNLGKILKHNEFWTKK